MKRIPILGLFIALFVAVTVMMGCSGPMPTSPSSSIDPVLCLMNKAPSDGGARVDSIEVHVPVLLYLLNNSYGTSTYTWSFGDGSSDTSTKGSIFHTFNAAGTYAVNLSVQGHSYPLTVHVFGNTVNIDPVLTVVSYNSITGVTRVGINVSDLIVNLIDPFVIGSILNNPNPAPYGWVQTAGVTIENQKVVFPISGNHEEIIFNGGVGFSTTQPQELWGWAHLPTSQFYRSSDSNLHFKLLNGQLMLVGSTPLTLPGESGDVNSGSASPVLRMTPQDQMLTAYFYLGHLPNSIDPVMEYKNSLGVTQTIAITPSTDFPGWGEVTISMSAIATSPAFFRYRNNAGGYADMESSMFYLPPSNSGEIGWLRFDISPLRDGGYSIHPV